MAGTALVPLLLILVAATQLHQCAAQTWLYAAAVLDGAVGLFSLPFVDTSPNAKCPLDAHQVDTSPDFDPTSLMGHFHFYPILNGLSASICEKGLQSGKKGFGGKREKGALSPSRR